MFGGKAGGVGSVDGDDRRPLRRNAQGAYVDVSALTGEAAAQAKAAEKAALDAEIKKMRARGYKPLVRNGQQLYCRSEGELGSRFERVRCNTLDELKQAELNGKDYVKSIQQQGSPTEFKGDGPGR